MLRRAVVSSSSIDHRSYLGGTAVIHECSPIHSSAVLSQLMNPHAQYSRDTFGWRNENLIEDSLSFPLVDAVVVLAAIDHILSLLPIG